MHPADKPGPQAQHPQCGQRIGHRPTRSLHPVFHRGIQHLAPVAFDQLHDAFFDAHQFNETVISLGKHIDNRIADADNLVGFHRVFSLNRHRSLIRQSAHLGLRAVQT